MTFAVVIATEPAGGAAGPGTAATTAELDLGDGAVIDRLLGQLDSLDVRETRIVCRPEHAPALRKRDPDVVESPDLAGDLRAIAELTRHARRTHGPEPILVLHGDVVAHGELLHRVVVADGVEALAVVAPGRPREVEPTRPVVRNTGGRVLSAGSRHHTVTDPTAVFRGVLKVGADHAETMAGVADRLAGLVAAGAPEVAPIRLLRHDAEEADLVAAEEADDDGEAAVPGRRRRAAAAGAGSGDAPGTGSRAGSEWRNTPTLSGRPRVHLYPDVLGGTAPTGADAPALLLVGLVRSGLRVRNRRVNVLVCERVLTPLEARAGRVAIDAVDEDRQRLVAAVKSNDGFFTTYAVSTYSRYIARWSARRGLTPNMVTTISMAVAVLAAVWFAYGDRLSMILGAVLLYFAFVLDCVDGQLARYTRQFSTLGAWLDATFDRAKEYVCYAGLAVGALASGVGDVWGLAITAMTLQTVRHMIDFSFGAAKRRKPPEPVRRVDLAAPTDQVLDPLVTARAPRRVSNLAVWLSARSERIPVFRWAKKMVVLPIGERFALISVTAAFFDARVTFLSLLVWGGLAASYTITGRVLRSLPR
jgi:Family of unknown function (DUF5941)/CDP-alcohol phosphatidyltransferase